MCLVSYSGGWADRKARVICQLVQCNTTSASDMIIIMGGKCAMWCVFDLVFVCIFVGSWRSTKKRLVRMNLHSQARGPESGSRTLTMVVLDHANPIFCKSESQSIYASGFLPAVPYSKQTDSSSRPQVVQLNLDSAEGRRRQRSKQSLQAQRALDIRTFNRDRMKTLYTAMRDKERERRRKFNRGQTLLHDPIQLGTRGSKYKH